MQSRFTWLWVDGVDVSAARSNPHAELHLLSSAAENLNAGVNSVKIRGFDTAGNPLEYRWSFVIVEPETSRAPGTARIRRGCTVTRGFTLVERDQTTTRSSSDETRTR